MAKYITDGKTDIGAYILPVRKKPCICIGQGNEIRVYGTFINRKCAEQFMDILADLVGAEKGGTNAD